MKRQRVIIVNAADNLPPKRPLRLFYRTEGFYDQIVAAPSKAAALRAWGTKRDLFRLGLAEESMRFDWLRIASVRPGTVYQKLVGRKGKFKPTED